MHTRRILAAAVLACCAALGCSQEKVNELLEQGKKQLDVGAKSATESIEQAKSTASSATGSAKEVLQLSGKIEVTLDAPLSTAACYARFIPATEHRPAVLQLQSYRDASSETFPSMLLRGEVEAASAGELVGQTVSVQVFVQKENSGPVWFSDQAALVELKITSADEQQLVAEFVQGKLLRTDGGPPAEMSGSLTGVWQTQ